MSQNRDDQPPRAAEGFAHIFSTVTKPRVFMCPNLPRDHEQFANFTGMTTHAFAHRLAYGFPPLTKVSIVMDESQQYMNVTMKSFMAGVEIFCARDIQFIRNSRGSWIFIDSLMAGGPSDQESELRRQGLGRLLLRNLVSIADKTGFTRLHTQAAQDGRIFWAKMGFSMDRNYAPCMVQFRDDLEKKLETLALAKEIKKEVKKILEGIPPIDHPIKTINDVDKSVNRKIHDLPYEINDQKLGHILLMSTTSYMAMLNLEDSDDRTLLARATEITPERASRIEKLRNYQPA